MILNNYKFQFIINIIILNLKAIEISSPAELSQISQPIQPFNSPRTRYIPNNACIIGLQGWTTAFFLRGVSMFVYGYWLIATHHDIKIVTHLIIKTLSEMSLAITMILNSKFQPYKIILILSTLSYKIVTFQIRLLRYRSKKLGFSLVSYLT